MLERSPLIVAIDYKDIREKVIGWDMAVCSIFSQLGVGLHTARNSLREDLFSDIEDMTNVEN